MIGKPLTTLEKVERLRAAAAECEEAELDLASSAELPSRFLRAKEARVAAARIRKERAAESLTLADWEEHSRIGEHAELLEDLDEALGDRLSTPESDDECPEEGDPA